MDLFSHQPALDNRLKIYKYYDDKEVEEAFTKERDSVASKTRSGIHKLVIIHV